MRLFLLSSMLLLNTAVLCAQSAETIPASPTPANPFLHPSNTPLKLATKPAADPTLTPDERCHAPAGNETGNRKLTDGVDMSVYMAQISKIINANWKPLIPKIADKPFHKKGTVTVCFALQPDGHVEPNSIILTGKSNDPAYDRAALGAIQTGVYPPLPKEFDQPRLLVSFCFQYNPDRPNTHPIVTHTQPGLPNYLAVTVGYKSKL